jgi:putative ABC transport system substrate-binding protein
MLGARVEGIVVLADPLTYVRRNQIVDFAKSHRLPGVYPAREFVELGGLISYGANLRDYWRRAAVYVDKIFKGTQPVDLPVEQPTRFELTINLKTAKTLGLTIPPTILAGADEIIE